MGILNNAKKVEEKATKEQREQAEILIKVVDELMAIFEEKDLQFWQMKTIHSLWGQRLTQEANVFLDKKTLKDLKV